MGLQKRGLADCALPAGRQLHGLLAGLLPTQGRVHQPETGFWKSLSAHPGLQDAPGVPTDAFLRAQAPADLFPIAPFVQLQARGWITSEETGKLLIVSGALNLEDNALLLLSSHPPAVSLVWGDKLALGQGLGGGSSAQSGACPEWWLC